MVERSCLSPSTNNLNSCQKRGYHEQAPSIFIPIGKSIDNKIVICGKSIFYHSTSNGIPLDLILFYTEKHNLLIDWKGFVEQALSENWQIHTIVSKIKNSIPLPYFNKIEPLLKAQILKTLNANLLD